MRSGAHFATNSSTPPNDEREVIPADEQVTDLEKDGPTKTQIIVLVILCIAIALIIYEIGYGSNSSTDRAASTNSANQSIFPDNVDSSHLNNTKQLDNDVMTKPMSENGLYGQVYSFEGEVVDTLQVNELDYALVSTSMGNVAIFNTFKNSYDTEEGAEVIESFGYSATLFEELPKNGSSGQFIATYMGFSTILQIPTFQYGANQLIDLVTCVNGHNIVNWTTTVEATCTTEGLRSGACSTCSFTRTENIPALGHTVNDYETLTESTCSERGTAHGICDVCGQDVEITLSLTPHTASGEWVVTSASGKTGTRVQYCLICGQQAASETFTLSTGQYNALSSANSYLKHMPFSYQGLIEQLEYEGYSYDDASLAVSVCGADWNEQALKQAESYLRHSHFSYQGLIGQLEYEGFTYEQAVYGVDNCGADWNEQAALTAESYLKHMSFSRDGLIEQLEYEGFTYEQAVYGVTAVGY